MNYIIDITFGILTITYGIILLTRRKFMIKRTYFSLFFPGFLILRQSIELAKMGNLSWPLLMLTCVFILGILISRYKFTLTNVNSQMVSSILTGILKEKNISCEKYENKIILNNYNNKEIKYIQSLNSVDIDFNHIKSLPFYKEIEEELRDRIKKLEVMIFPYSGLFYLVLGIIIMIVVL